MPRKDGDTEANKIQRQIKVRSLYLRGIRSPMRISALLKVNIRTIQRDLVEVCEEMREFAKIQGLTDLVEAYNRKEEEYAESWRLGGAATKVRQEGEQIIYTEEELRRKIYALRASSEISNDMHALCGLKVASKPQGQPEVDEKLQELVNERLSKSSEATKREMVTIFFGTGMQKRTSQ